MANLNKIMLMGNATRDPEIRYTPKGLAVCELGLAVNRKWKDKDGDEWKEECVFVDVTLFGRTAEVANEYLRKGRPVYIEGRLQLDSWEDKQTGQKRSKLKVVGEELQLLGGREESGAENGPKRSQTPDNQAQRPAPKRPASTPKAPVDPDLDVEGDEIPF